MLSNLVTFSRKPIGVEEFLNQMIEVSGIIIDRRPKVRLSKKGKQTVEKIGMSIIIFLEKTGTDFTFYLALNTGGQKKTVYPYF